MKWERKEIKKTEKGMKWRKRKLSEEIGNEMKMKEKIKWRKRILNEENGKKLRKRKWKNEKMKSN